MFHLIAFALCTHLSPEQRCLLHCGTCAKSYGLPPGRIETQQHECPICQFQVCCAPSLPCCCDCALGPYSFKVHKTLWLSVNALLLSSRLCGCFELDPSPEGATPCAHIASIIPHQWFVLLCVYPLHCRKCVLCVEFAAFFGVGSVIARLYRVLCPSHLNWNAAGH